MTALVQDFRCPTCRSIDLRHDEMHAAYVCRECGRRTGYWSMLRGSRARAAKAVSYEEVANMEFGP